MPTPPRARRYASRTLSEQRYGGNLRIAIGINSGPVMVGTVGGGGRLEFTVIGDPVNVAARVEEATRDTGDAILLTESTRALLGEKWRGRLDERGSMPLKGKSEPIPLYALRREAVRPSAAEAAEHRHRVKVRLRQARSMAYAARAGRYAVARRRQGIRCTHWSSRMDSSA